jgi:phage shock protein A
MLVSSNEETNPMRVLHRLKQTLSVSIESLLDQVENQEAVVLATIREVEQGATRVRMHRKQCERRIDALEETMKRQSTDARQWRDRARRLRDERDKALECVRRARAAEATAVSANEQLEKQKELLESIREDERVIEEKLDELRRRRSQLSSRQARSDAQSGVESLGDIDCVFDRWEARIEEREAVNEARAASQDRFARTLSDEEERAALSADLDRLLAEEPTHA